MAIVKGRGGTVQANVYALRPVQELYVGEEETPTPAPPSKDAAAPPDASAPGGAESEGIADGASAAEESTPETDPLRFARMQADALLHENKDPEEWMSDFLSLYGDDPEEAGERMSDFMNVYSEALMRDARKEAEDYVEAYKRQALAEFESELEKQRFNAQKEGYDAGYAAGMTAAMAEAKVERNKLAAEQIKAVTDFLESATRARDRLFDENREEMKNLAMTIAEKVIQVSLKNSSDILLRMVEAATDTHKRCEWAHIYVADCDVKGKAFSAPELTAALNHISDRVRVIPMSNDESGTCIVELPDAILDASVSTQLANIREVLDSVGTDDDSPTVFFTGPAPKT